MNSEAGRERQREKPSFFIWFFLIFVSRMCFYLFSGGISIDLWSEIVATENQQQQQPQEVGEIYRRRRPQKTHQDVDL
jgi:hypothetical protein